MKARYKGSEKTLLDGNFDQTQTTEQTFSADLFSQGGATIRKRCGWVEIAVNCTPKKGLPLNKRYEVATLPAGFEIEREVWGQSDNSVFFVEVVNQKVRLMAREANNEGRSCSIFLYGTAKTRGGVRNSLKKIVRKPVQRFAVC